MNKRTFFISLLAGLAFTSCVSLSEHENLQNKYEQTAKE